MDIYGNNNNMMNNGYGQQQMQSNNQLYMTQPSVTRQRTIDVTDFVSGFNGAINYPIPMGRSGLLIDFSIGKMWIKSPGGPVPMEEFDVKRCEPQKIQNDPISREEFDSTMNNVNDTLSQLKDMIANLQPNDGKVNNRQNRNNQKG